MLLMCQFAFLLQKNARWQVLSRGRTSVATATVCTGIGKREKRSDLEVVHLRFKMNARAKALTLFRTGIMRPNDRPTIAVDGS